MSSPPLNIVTGAFGYSGQYIAARLLARGERVRTLTNHRDSASPLHAQVEVAPLDFSSADALAREMAGGRVLYNTYWVRFAHGGVDHAQAVANSRTLIRAAEKAGVERIVHTSITNPSLDSPLPYFRGKAQVEEAIRASSLGYAILRPAVLFGQEDILLNNIAWLLRKFPVFAVPGSGEYGLQPIFVGDMAALAVESGQRSENIVADAAGPERYRYIDLVQMLREAVGSAAWVVRVPPAIVIAASRLIGSAVGDVVLTSDEVRGLMDNLLVSREPPRGKMSLCAWVREHAATIGARYASELARHFK